MERPTAVAYCSCLVRNEYLLMTICNPLIRLVRHQENSLDLKENTQKKVRGPLAGGPVC